MRMNTAVLKRVDRVKGKSAHDNPERYCRSFQVTVPWPQNFREIWENVSERTRHWGFDEFICLFHSLKLAYYQIIITFRDCSLQFRPFFWQHFSKQPYIFSTRISGQVLGKILSSYPFFVNLVLVLFIYLLLGLSCCCSTRESWLHFIQEQFARMLPEAAVTSPFLHNLEK